MKIIFTFSNSFPKKDERSLHCTYMNEMVYELQITIRRIIISIVLSALETQNEFQSDKNSVSHC